MPDEWYNLTPYEIKRDRLRILSGTKDGYSCDLCGMEFKKLEAASRHRCKA